MSFHDDLEGNDLHGSRVDLNAGSPIGSVTPLVVGELIFDTTTSPATLYRATGLTNNDWEAIAGGAGSGGTRRVYLSFGLTSGVQNSPSPTYLDHAGVSTAAVGIRLASAATLIGITYSADNTPGGARTYDVEVVSDPTGAPAVLGTALAIGNAEQDDARRDLSAAVGAGTLIGARIVRTAGTGKSSFDNVIVEIELEVME